MRKLLLFVWLLIGAGTTLRADNTVDSLTNLLNSSPHDTVKVSCMNDLAYEFVTDDPKKSMDYAQQALALAEQVDYPAGKMNAYNNMGLANYYQSKYEAALGYFQRSLALAKQIHHNYKTAAALNNIGLVYDDKAEMDKALYYYLQSMKISEQDKDSKYLYASTLNNVALIYQSQERYDVAFDYLSKSLAMKRTLGNKRGEASTLHNLGLLFKQKKDYAKSLQYYEEALALRQKLNDESGTALTLNNIGSLYETQNEYEKALPYFEQSVTIRRRQEDKTGLASSLFSLGSNYCSRIKFDQGILIMNEALALAKETGAKETIKQGYELLTDAYSEKGDFANAFQNQSKFIAMKDSIYNEQSAKQVAELQAQYEDEKKQREIDLLTKDKEIQSLQLNKNKLWMIVLYAAIIGVLLLSVLLFNRYKLKQRANEQLEHRNLEIVQQKKEITDSINYAKRIQESILPPTEHWQRLLPNSFIFYRPKDIVSGDFYWIEERKEFICFAAVDCTGHGVPGALMSVVGFNLLTQAVNEVGLTKPSDILKHLDAGVTRTLRQSGAGVGVKDGMDLSLCSLNRNSLELQYSGAFNSLYYVRNGELTEIKADKFPIGINLDGIVDEYTNHSIQLQAGDAVYLFSDGYADQFGGPKGKKFKYNQLKDLLCSISTLPANQQQQKLAATFDAWKGDLEQVDDVIVIGVRV